MILALTGNIREGWKGLPRTGTLKVMEKRVL